SKFWDRFMRENRQANLNNTFKGYVESGEVLRVAFRNKDKKRIYVFPTDQFPYWGAASHKIGKFMNQPTHTMTGGAALACKFGMAVYEICFVRKRRGRYKVFLEKICDDAGRLSPEDIMVKYYSILEKYIIEDPGNYLWSHKRWK
ncbi:MAG: lysophospholipid acyltransferase family protein, partial [Candidatus Cryptobacteroides sp.]